MLINLRGFAVVLVVLVSLFLQACTTIDCGSTRDQPCIILDDAAIKQMYVCDVVSGVRILLAVNDIKSMLSETVITDKIVAWRLKDKAPRHHRLFGWEVDVHGLALMATFRISSEKVHWLIGVRPIVVAIGEDTIPERSESDSPQEKLGMSIMSPWDGLRLVTNRDLTKLVTDVLILEGEELESVRIARRIHFASPESLQRVMDSVLHTSFHPSEPKP